jgi:hypothetical protein
MASASYVAGYVKKKQHRGQKTHVNPLTGEVLQDEFARMSLRPAIGRTWIERYWPDVYPRDFVVVDGYEAKPPRYYDKFMDLEDDKGGCPKRRRIMMEVREKRHKEAIELSRATLDAKEKIHQSRNSLYAGRHTL